MSFGTTASSYRAAGVVSGSDAFSTQALADAPLLYWRFNETSGTVVTDSSGNGHNGVYNNSPTFSRLGLVQGSADTCVYFNNSTNDYASLADASWMDVASLTLTCIAQVNVSGLRMIVSRYHDPDNDRSWFLYNDTTLKFYIRGSDGTETIVDSGVQPATGSVYYMAAYGGAAGIGIRIYDSSGLLGSGTAVGHPVNPSSRNFLVARSDDGANYQNEAYIDELTFYDKILSTARLDTMASLALSPQPRWINRTNGVGVRNGTATHTLPFASTHNGSLLVAAVSSSAVNSVGSAGWTTRLDMVNGCDLTILTRVCNAGETSLIINSSATNYPLNYTVYEFPSGSAYYSGITQVDSGSWPTLTGLPGTAITVMAVASSAKISSSDPPENATWYNPYIKDVDVMTASDGVTEGVYTTVGYRDFYTYTSATPPNLYYVGNTQLAVQALFSITTP